MLAKSSDDQMLVKAKSYANNGDIEEAKTLYQSILKAKLDKMHQEFAYLNKPKQNDAMHPPKEVLDQLANLYNEGQLSAVVNEAQVLTNQYPESFLVWNLLGASATQIDMLDLAINAYNKALNIKPNYAEVYCNISVAFQAKGKLDEAIEACKKAISLKPDHVAAYSNMGNALKDQDKLDEAIEAYKKAITLKPDYINPYYNMGIALKDQGKLDEALEAYKKVISINPNYVLAHSNVGNIFKNQGKIDKAIESYDKAISIKPDHADAHLSLSNALLNCGRIEEGLNEYEWRWKTSNFLSMNRQFSKPLWDGKNSLHNKKLLLWCEQGVGDTISWSSNLSIISSQADRCILECQEKLVPLLKRSFPNIEVKPENRNFDLKRNDFDFHLPMGSIYKHIIREISPKNKPKAFLLPDPTRVKFWKKRLSFLGQGPYIGISWKSSNMSPNRLPNYTSISDWSPVLKIPNVTFINLQHLNFKDDLTKIKNKFGVKVHNFDDLDQFNNIDDIAALYAALDMVVSIQSSVPLISAGVGTLTKLASWKQSQWNNIMHNPVGPFIDIFGRNTRESWEKVFNLIAKDICKQIKKKEFYE